MEGLMQAARGAAPGSSGAAPGSPRGSRPGSPRGSATFGAFTDGGVSDADISMVCAQSGEFVIECKVLD